MTDRVSSGRWSSLAEAEREVRRWAQKHMISVLTFVYKFRGKLPAPPSSHEDWMGPWALFDTRWDEADPVDQYYDWWDDAWRAYQEGARYAWQWLEQAIQLIEKDTRECARKPYEQTCLDLLPPVDPELHDEYRYALKSICIAMSS